jgi:hypothetical protein
MHALRKPSAMTARAVVGSERRCSDNHSSPNDYAADRSWTRDHGLRFARKKSYAVAVLGWHSVPAVFDCLPTEGTKAALCERRSPPSVTHGLPRSACCTILIVHPWRSALGERVNAKDGTYAPAAAFIKAWRELLSYSRISCLS